MTEERAQKSQTTSFGTTVRSLRQEVGLSIRHVAQEAGISTTFLADVEKNRRMPGRDVVVRLAAVLKVPTQRLLEHDPREYIGDILAAANADPETRTLLAQVCRGLGEGRISKQELARVAGGRRRRSSP